MRREIRYVELDNETMTMSKRLNNGEMASCFVVVFTFLGFVFLAEQRKTFRPKTVQDVSDNAGLTDNSEFVTGEQLNEHANKQNRSYEHLIGKLKQGKYKYCADMFGRKVTIPWNLSQEERKEKFKQMVKNALIADVAEAQKVRRSFPLIFVGE